MKITFLKVDILKFEGMQLFNTSKYIHSEGDTLAVLIASM